jgi:hypothetical protein
MTVVAEGVETEAQRKVLAERLRAGLSLRAGTNAFERWLLDHGAERARAMRDHLDCAPADAVPVKRSAAHSA